MKLTLSVEKMVALLGQPGYEDLRKVALSPRIREGLRDAMSSKVRGASKSERSISDDDCLAFWIGAPNFGGSIVQERYEERLKEEEARQVKGHIGKQAKPSATLKLAQASA